MRFYYPPTVKGAFPPRNLAVELPRTAVENMLRSIDERGFAPARVVIAEGHDDNGGIPHGLLISVKIIPDEKYHSDPIEDIVWDLTPDHQERLLALYEEITSYQTDEGTR